MTESAFEHDRKERMEAREVNQHAARRWIAQILDDNGGVNKSGFIPEHLEAALFQGIERLDEKLSNHQIANDELYNDLVEKCLGLICHHAKALVCEGQDTFKESYRHLLTNEQDELVPDAAAASVRRFAETLGIELSLRHASTVKRERTASKHHSGGIHHRH